MQKIYKQHDESLIALRRRFLGVWAKPSAVHMNEGLRKAAECAVALGFQIEKLPRSGIGAEN